MSASDKGTSVFKGPLYVAWEITHLCNARCVHCYSDSGPGADRFAELSTDEALDLIGQLADAGVLILAFSGGEPMLRKDWRRLVSYAVSRGLGANIGTNGSCITASVAAELRDLGVHSVTVSIDSHRPEVHDRFRGLSGLFRSATTAVRTLAEIGVRVVVGFTPTTLNWRDGADVVSLARDLGAAAVNLSEYVPAGRGSTGLALAPEELRQVLQQWVGLRETYKDSIQVIWHDCRVGMLVPEEEKRSYDYADIWRNRHLASSGVVADWADKDFDDEFAYWRSLTGPWRGVFINFWTEVRNKLAKQNNDEAWHYWGSPRRSNIFNKPSLIILSADFFQYLCDAKATIDSPEMVTSLVDDWLSEVDADYFNRDWKLQNTKKDSPGIRKTWSQTWVEYRKNPTRLPSGTVYRKSAT
jgi:MoaA/NifB/PqqE/SkfB family radical SAM enzyme